jgi:hypothetical protein
MTLLYFMLAIAGILGGLLMTAAGPDMHWQGALAILAGLVALALGIRNVTARNPADGKALQDARRIREQRSAPAIQGEAFSEGASPSPSSCDVPGGREALQELKTRVQDWPGVANIVQMFGGTWGRPLR